jgi:hypothetical protein
MTLAYDIREVEVGSGGSERTDLVVTMHALGTAIASAEPDGTFPSTQLSLDLSLSPNRDHILGGAR